MSARPLRVLFVDPVREGSGEIITTLHMGRALRREGAEVHYLGTPLARRLLGEEFAGAVQPLGDDPEANFRRWTAALSELRPHAVVFADLPFFWLRHGTVQLRSPAALLDAIESLDVPVFSLDHMGMAQGPITLYFGPPHLAQAPHRIPALPERVGRLLPCPMHEPGEVEGRKGAPFRYWEVPIVRPPGEREQVRASVLRKPGERLVFYPIPGWAVRVGEAIGHPYHRLLPEFFEYYFGGLGAPVTIVVVNGQAIPARAPGDVRIVPMPILDVDRFEALMFAADLLLTDNGISIAMGKALCGLQACAHLRNRWRLAQLDARLDGRIRELMWATERAQLGSVYPYEVFPAGTRAEIEALGLFRDNTITEGFASVELFGGEQTRAELRALLLDEERREQLALHQRAYVERLAAAPSVDEVLRAAIAGRGAAA